MKYTDKKHLVVYGAGLAGRSVLSYLQSQGLTVAAFLDRNTSIGAVDGLPVYTCEEWAKVHGATDTCVIIGLFNHYVDIGEVECCLEQLGFGRIISLIEFVGDFPKDQPFRYWLVPPSFYLENAERVQRMRAKLADDKSRQLLDSIIEYRITGKHRVLPEFSANQYFPEDLPAWPQPVRLIDCGAYVGDSVLDMQKAGIKFEAVATFEPNIRQYQDLVSNLKFINSINYPCGVSNKNFQCGFNSSTGAGGHIVENGEESIVCVRLDDALPGFNPTLIKMDVEGEELLALEGAECLIRKNRPGLAISVYHRAEHLWTVFEQLDALNLGYSFYLRSHAHSTFDTVLYAMTV